MGRRGLHRPASEAPPDQLSLFMGEHPVVTRLKGLDVEQMTPLEAMNALAELRREFLGEEEDDS